MNFLLLKLLRIISFNYMPFRSKKELLVVLYHQVNDKKYTFYPAVPTKVYQETCLFLAKYYEIIHFSEVEHYYQSNPSKPAAIITFDDGMSDIREHVLPFMEKHQLKFNINIDTEILETKLPQDFLRVYDILNTTPKIPTYIDSENTSKPITIQYDKPFQTENEFTEVLSNLSSKDKRNFTIRMHDSLGMESHHYSKVLSSDDLRNLAKNKLVEIGSHSHTHSVLTKLDAIDIQNELQKSKEILEHTTDKHITVIAYPNGCSSEKIDQTAIQLGYQYLLKTDNKTTIIDKKNKTTIFYRINQYHQNTELALAHTFGVLQKIKNFI